MGISIIFVFIAIIVIASADSEHARIYGWGSLLFFGALGAYGAYLISGRGNSAAAKTE
jgi:hypothetical protein